MATAEESGSDLQEIDELIASTPGWKGRKLAEVRKLINEACPNVVEEIKWRKPSNSMRGVPTWSHFGLICTGETYKKVVKLTFAHGASLPDPDGLFNSSLAGKVRRAIDISEGDELDPEAFKGLIRAAADRNEMAND